MVFIDSKKYACETCIKGHRSSACKHTDRPLFEIKKKGRPVTQCEHCRELRKTKQVHVKCICELKSSTTTTPTAPPAFQHHQPTPQQQQHQQQQHQQPQQQQQPQHNLKKGTSKGTDGAAFPNGLPESLALEAPAAQHRHPFDPDHPHHPSSSPSSSSPSSSPNGGVTTNCCCMSGEPCICWTPRKSAPAPSSGGKPRRKTMSALSTTVPIAPNTHRGHNHRVTGSGGLDASTTTTAAPAAPDDEALASSLPHAPHQILARISELRPVLPRPGRNNNNNSSAPAAVATTTYAGAPGAIGLGPLHIPSSGIAHGHVARHHETAFSPYGRAFLHHHPHPERIATSAAAIDGHRRFSCSSLISSLKPYLFDRAPAHSIPSASAEANNGDNNPMTTNAASITFPSPCGCGERCTCPACFQHNGAASFVPTLNAYHTCTNPGGCNACLDYTILSLPPDTALSIPEFQPPPLPPPPGQQQQQQQQQMEGGGDGGAGEGIDEWLRQVQANVGMNDVSPVAAATTATAATAAAVNPSVNENNMIKEEPCSVWDRPCVLCASYFCSCKSRGDCGNLSATQPCNDDTSNNNCDNVTSSPAEAAEMSDFAMYSLPYPVDQNFGGHDSSSSSAGSSQRMFDYTEFGFSDPTGATTTDDEVMFPLVYPAYGGGPMDIVGKAQPPLQQPQQQQQAVYINERGFYSDSFLNLLSSSSDEAMFPIGGIPGDTEQFPISGTTYLNLVPPLGAAARGSTFSLPSESSSSSSSSLYAMSNPALSDTESSSFDSVEDVSTVPPSSSHGFGNAVAVQQDRVGRELSPESLEELRTLY